MNHENLALFVCVSLVMVMLNCLARVSLIAQLVKNLPAMQ